MQMLTNYLGTLNQVSGLSWLDPNLVLGIVLTAFVLLVPKGLVALVRDGGRFLVERLRQGGLSASRTGKPEAAE